MIKTIFAFFVLVGVVVVLSLSIDMTQGLIKVVENNREKTPIELSKAGVYICSDCGSLINTLMYSAQAIMPDGKTYFFDDIGCLSLWYNKQKNKEGIIIWVYTVDTERYILAEEAWYSRNNITPYRYGFGAHELRLYGVSDDYFDDIVLSAIRGETLLYPALKVLYLERKL